MHKYYYTYKITILKGSLAGHYYYGQHQTNNLNDGYAGSGSIISMYYKKYDKIEGITYVKSILQFYNNIDELNKAEEILIGDKYETDPLCLNLCKGGGGHIQGKDKKKRKGHICSDSTKKKIGNKNKNNKARLGMKTSEETKQKMREAAKNRAPVSEETRQKQREAASKRGKHWKKDPITNKRIWY